MPISSFHFFRGVCSKEFRPQTQKWELRLSIVDFGSDSVEISFALLSRCKFRTNFPHKAQVTIHDTQPVHSNGYSVEKETWLRHSRSSQMTTPLFTRIRICQHITNRLLYSAPPYLLPCGLTFGPLGGDEAAVTINLNVRLVRKKGSPQEMTGWCLF